MTNNKREVPYKELSKGQNPPHMFKTSKRKKNFVKEKFRDLKMDWSMGHSNWAVFGWSTSDEAKDAQAYLANYVKSQGFEDSEGWCIYTTVDSKTNTLYARKEALPKFQVFEKYDQERVLPNVEPEPEPEPPAHKFEPKVVNDPVQEEIDDTLDTMTGTMEKVTRKLRRLDRRIDNLTLEFLSLKEFYDDAR